MVIAAGRGRVISNFALTHLEAAKQFSAKVAEIEHAHAGQPFGNFWQEISVYCSSSLIMAAASLEALINELFLGSDDLREAIPDFDAFFWGGHKTRRVCLLFKRTKGFAGLEKRPALRKYKKALSILGKPQLSTADDVYRNAEALIGLRNYFIHFKPLWDEGRRNDRLEEQLSGKFELSPFVDEGAEFLAKKCMSAGCAEWAVTTAVEFIQDFAQRSELDPKKMAAFRL